MKRLWQTGGDGRRGYANAFYGVVDYLALPAGMLLAAPFLLRHLGAAQYGIWLLASAAVSGGGIVSGSFGDAVIKFVGECRGRQDWVGVKRIVRSMMSINLILSGVLACLLWCLAPYFARHIAKLDLGLRDLCVTTLRIGCGLLVVKSIESVFICTLRAFETYGSTVRISIATRFAILGSAIVLTRFGSNVVWIMDATFLLSGLGTFAQAIALQNKIGRFSPVPIWHKKTVADVALFGTFSWAQAVSSLVFGQADRIVVGFFMGAPAVAYYGLCVQAAQPVHGLISSGMHFLFPHLSARYRVAPIAEIRHKILLAIKVNLGLVIALSLPTIILGAQMFRVWIGSAFVQQSRLLFPIVVFSFALLGINITAHYALLAIGQVRVITYFNLLGGVAMLLLMALLIPVHGLQGAAVARLVYGPITCLAYLQLYRAVWRPDKCASLSQQSRYEIVATSAD